MVIWQTPSPINCTRGLCMTPNEELAIAAAAALVVGNIQIVEEIKGPPKKTKMK